MKLSEKGPEEALESAFWAPQSSEIRLLDPVRWLLGLGSGPFGAFRTVSLGSSLNRGKAIPYSGLQ